MEVIKGKERILGFLKESFGDKHLKSYTWILNTPAPILFVTEDFLMLCPWQQAKKDVMNLIPLACRNLDVRFNVKQFITELNEQVTAKLADGTRLLFKAVDLAIAAEKEPTNIYKGSEVASLADGDFLGTVCGLKKTDGECLTVTSFKDIDDAAKDNPQSAIFAEYQDNYLDLLEHAEKAGYKIHFYRFAPHLGAVN